MDHDRPKNGGGTSIPLDIVSGVRLGRLVKSCRNKPPQQQSRRYIARRVDAGLPRRVVISGGVHVSLAYRLFQERASRDGPVALLQMPHEVRDSTA